MQQKEDLNAVTFQVRPDANKVEIRTAVETIFNVKVASVRTATCEGKSSAWDVSRGDGRSGRRPIVTLQAGHKIELVEGA